MAVCFDLSGRSLKDHLQGLICCFCLKASREVMQLPQWCSLKAFKGKSICYPYGPGYNSWDTQRTKKLGNEEPGGRETWEGRALKSAHIF